MFTPQQTPERLDEDEVLYNLSLMRGFTPQSASLISWGMCLRVTSDDAVYGSGVINS